MLTVGSVGQPIRRKTSRFDGLVDMPSLPSMSSSDGGVTCEETLYKHYLQVIYTPVSSLKSI